MWRTFESYSGSYAGRMAPPGMPKATSTPSASSERTSEPAPVVATGDTVATAWAAVAAAATVAGVGSVGEGLGSGWSRHGIAFDSVGGSVTRATKKALVPKKARDLAHSQR